ncbi:MULTISPECIES: DMT family transporter [Bordetella]|uniref:Guanidinium exporter n=2 Tax=Bordetella TaxID=517 RepID=A0A261W195_9BORD|nr:MULTISPECIES: multidrug efflux SMR transporter [Bordetella]MDM9558770.1 multidrug efflux SMR transporter [Bordetella petrii]OZI80019.1 QacE family quaternary ammonium compound efflux SMR transporter [Bordetella genomosp. 2]
MAWLMLLAAAGLEIVMGVALKLNEGWTRALPSAVAVGAGLGSIYLLAKALQTLPVGTAYAIWTGLGALGLVVIGIAAFGESMHWQRLLFLAITAAGLIGLRYVEAGG